MCLPRLQGDNVPEDDDVNLCCEALEVLTIAIALFPQSIESLNKDRSWHNFIIDLTLVSKVRAIRCTAADQFALIATKCTEDRGNLRYKSLSFFERYSRGNSFLFAVCIGFSLIFCSLCWTP